MACKSLMTPLKTNPKLRFNNAVGIDEKVFNTADWAVTQTSKSVTTLTTTESTVPGGSTSHPIIYKELNSSNKKIRVVDNNKKIELKDGKGDDANVEFIIKSGNAKFSDDGKSIEGNGKVTIEIDYDENRNWWEHETYIHGGTYQEIRFRECYDGSGDDCVNRR